MIPTGYKLPHAAVLPITRPVSWAPTGISLIDPANIPGLIAGYRVGDTVRTGSAVDEWTDISGNGYDATAVSTKDTVYGSGADEYAAGGQRYAPASAIPFDEDDSTIVCIFGSGRGHRNEPGQLSTFALTNPATNGGGVLVSSGAFQFYNATRLCGAYRNSGPMNSACLRFEASQVSTRANGMSETAAANGTATTTVFDHIWGYAGGGGFKWNPERVALYFYDRALTDAELSQIERFHGVAQNTSALHILGDSWVAGTGASASENYYARQLSASTGLDGCIYGASGAGFANYSAASFAASVTSSLDAGLPTVAVLDLGKNDLAAGTTAATLQTTISSFAGTVTGTGVDLVICNMPPRTAGFSGGADAASYETQRNAFNSWLSTAGICDAVADVAGNANLGDVADVAGSYYSGDGIHLSDLGHTKMASVVKTAIDSL